MCGAKDIRLSEGHECWRGVFIKLFNVKPFRTESRVKDMSYLVFSCSVVIGVFFGESTSPTPGTITPNVSSFYAERLKRRTEPG